MNRTLSFAAIALVALVAAGAWYITSQSSTAQTVPMGSTPLTATNSVVLTATDDEAPAELSGIVEMTLGDENAPVTVIEYASFTCGHCANFHNDQLQQIKADYVDTGKVKFIYRDVFFDRIGLWASMVARCEPARFFGMVDLLYTKQGEWLDGNDPVALSDNLRKLGKVAGMSEEKLTACMQDQDKAQSLVAWFQKNQEADNIDSTPTLVINGEKLSNMPYPEIKKILDAALEN